MKRGWKWFFIISLPHTKNCFAVAARQILIFDCILIKFNNRKLSLLQQKKYFCHFFLMFLSVFFRGKQKGFCKWRKTIRCQKIYVYKTSSSNFLEKKWTSKKGGECINQFIELLVWLSRFVFLRFSLTLSFRSSFGSEGVRALVEIKKVSHKNWFLHFVMVLRISNNCYSIYGWTRALRNVQRA